MQTVAIDNLSISKISYIFSFIVKGWMQWRQAQPGRR
jgi:hypothetical protein